MSHPVETTAGLAAAVERPNIFVVPQGGRGLSAPDGSRSQSGGVFASGAQESAGAQPTRPPGGWGPARTWKRDRRFRLRFDWAGIARVAVAAISAGALVTLIGLGSGRPAERPPRPAIDRTDPPAANVEPAVLPRHSHPRRPHVQRERRTRRVPRPVPQRQPVPAVAPRQPSQAVRPSRTAVPVPARPASSAPALPARVPAGAPPEFF
jgi:hypothetical protein